MIDRVPVPIVDYLTNKKTLSITLMLFINRDFWCQQKDFNPYYMQTI